MTESTKATPETFILSLTFKTFRFAYSVKESRAFSLRNLLILALQ